MSSLSYARHRIPPAIIQHAVWLYFRFGLSYRDVEDLLAEGDGAPVGTQVRPRLCRTDPRAPATDRRQEPLPPLS